VSKFTSSAISVAIGLIFSVGAMAQTMSKDDYKTGMDSIAAQYESDKTRYAWPKPRPPKLLLKPPPNRR
jgi:hypothetical protein